VLTFAGHPDYRRQLKGMRNLQEGRHDLARHMFHGRRGELHRAYHAGMEDQLGALGLVPVIQPVTEDLRCCLARVGAASANWPVSASVTPGVSPSAGAR
jgi:Tn3 transposase DDE domain-containing protein